MKKSNTLVFLCKECGNEYNKWVGQCVGCGGWNTLKEYNSKIAKVINDGVSSGAEKVLASEIVFSNIMRQSTGWEEFDRVLGKEKGEGGLVRGSVVLLTGEPGVGKSTLLSQLAINIARGKFEVLYISGEESVGQIGMRLARLIDEDQDKEVLGYIKIHSIDNVDWVLESIKSESNLSIIIVDSIQTIYDSNMVGAVGSVNQIKESAYKLISVSKSENIPMVLVGHVTKDGSIAGPKLLEHMVDVVLSFEGDKQSSLRILRGKKNRFGSVNEVGVFVMSNEGLKEADGVLDVFVSSMIKGVSGSALSIALEGTRPFVVEIQALVTNSQFPVPRRVVSGYDYNRVMTIIAVLIQRCGIRLDSKDVYVNVVGGIHLDDSGVDLAIAIAIVSSVKNKPVNEDQIFVGELGLAGEIRLVKDWRLRVNQALRLGYKNIYGPKSVDAIAGVLEHRVLVELLPECFR